jgi:hypothetical protein
MLAGVARFRMRLAINGGASVLIRIVAAIRKYAANLHPKARIIGGRQFVPRRECDDQIVMGEHQGICRHYQSTIAKGDACL